MKYRIILINTKTGERKMLGNIFTSRKKAIECATKFCLNVDNADFEVIPK